VAGDDDDLSRPPQSWDPERYERNARFVSDLGQGVLDLLAARAGECILDLGCGDGVLTERLVTIGCHVVGIDGSAAQVAAACQRGLDARVGDGEALDFPAEFDAVFSNAALHWMRQPDRVIEGVWRTLRPGGRFVGEMGGHGCVQTVIDALTAVLAAKGIDAARFNPWYFPTVDDYRARLQRRGFRVDSIILFPRPTPLPGDMTGWLETFAESFASALPTTERAAFLAEVQQRLEPHLRDASGQWSADYVRLRFAATKPG
jgi:trans-aconitate methyltransferase